MVLISLTEAAKARVTIWRYGLVIRKADLHIHKYAYKLRIIYRFSLLFCRYDSAVSSQLSDL